MIRLESWQAALMTPELQLDTQCALLIRKVIIAQALCQQQANELCGMCWEQQETENLSFFFSQSHGVHEAAKQSQIRVCTLLNYTIIYAACITTLHVSLNLSMYVIYLERGCVCLRTEFVSFSFRGGTTARRSC